MKNEHSTLRAHFFPFFSLKKIFYMVLKCRTGFLKSRHFSRHLYQAIILVKILFFRYGHYGHFGQKCLLSIFPIAQKTIRTWHKISFYIKILFLCTISTFGCSNQIRDFFRKSNHPCEYILHNSADILVEKSYLAEYIFRSIFLWNVKSWIKFPINCFHQKKCLRSFIYTGLFYNLSDQEKSSNSNNNQ